MQQSDLLFTFPQTIARHFKQIPIQEKETITYFIYMAKTHKSKLDQKNENHS